MGLSRVTRFAFGLLVSALGATLSCTGTASPTGIESTVLTGANDATAGAGDTGDVTAAPPPAAADAGDDSNSTSSAVTDPLTGDVALGSTLRTTTSLNLRTGPGTANSVRLVLPSGADVLTVNVTSPQDGWYNVEYQGVQGWSSGKYLTFIKGPVTAPTDRDLAIARAQGGVGFSYWWGHGRWVPQGATSSTIGACTGSCPSCTHSGGYGADCSGYVGKIWQVPSTNSDPEVDSHPYSTVSFLGNNSQWVTIDRAALQPADALVYNQNGSGHICLSESGDGWGSMWVYEAKGCSYGIIHDLRTAGSAYKAIARVGY